MLTQRQNEILKVLIGEYIKTAEPISSDFLAKKYDFGLCSSAIRIEMQNLIKAGFLEQPHTSAGRIPTDQAYRFFVDSIIRSYEAGRKKKIENELEDLLSQKSKNQFELASHLAKFLADTSNNLTVVHFIDDNISWKEGWDEISKEPEFSDQGFIFDFFNFLNDFEQKIKKLEIQEINIYIGHEIPISRAENLSLICSACPISKNQTAFISIIGPRRMDYDKNINLLYSLNKALREL